VTGRGVVNLGNPVAGGNDFDGDRHGDCVHFGEGGRLASMADNKPK